MLGRARLDREVDVGQLDRELGEGALVGDVDHVAAGSAMIVAIRARLPGLSGTPTRRRTRRWVRTRPRRITAESSRLSMLPPHSDEPDLAAAEALGIAHHGGEAGRTGTLGHRLLDLEQLQDRGLDRRLLDQQHLVRPAAR